MSDTEIIQKIRQMEKDIVSDIKNINHVLSITECLKDSTMSSKVRLASLHSLRRVYLNLLENKELFGEFKLLNSKQTIVRTWIKEQYQDYLEGLRMIIMECEDILQEPAIKTVLAFVPRTTLFYGKDLRFDIHTFAIIIQGLICCNHELSAEILLMCRDEIFSKHDCVYFTLKILIQTISDMKVKLSNVSTQQSTNVFDILRVILLPDDMEDDSFLVSRHNTSSDDDQEDKSDEDENDDDEDQDEDNDDHKKKAKNTSIAIIGSKRKMNLTSESMTKKRGKMSLSDRLYDRISYQKLFSKSWILLLALPFNHQQHKIILKHLSDHVIEHLTKPLLLADYLTKSYESGGIVSVLALESLFQLILKHNLDYPNFFQSLYKLCKKDIFEAKYRTKFMKLLSLSLQSSNLPEYIVAAFIKRLCRLCLGIPSPAIYYCLSQIIYLLRKHPQCQLLIDRIPTKSKMKDMTETIYGITFEDKFNHLEDNLEKCNALESSLWELKILSNHYVHGIALLAKSLESSRSTSSGVDGIYLNVSDFIDRNYSDMIEEELKGLKGRSALAYKQPNQLFPTSSTIANNFG